MVSPAQVRRSPRVAIIPAPSYKEDLHTLDYERRPSSGWVSAGYVWKFSYYHNSGLYMQRIAKSRMVPLLRGPCKRRCLLNRVYASDETRLDAIHRASSPQLELDSEIPSFVQSMLQSHVTGGFWLVWVSQNRIKELCICVSGVKTWIEWWVERIFNSS